MILIYIELLMHTLRKIASVDPDGTFLRRNILFIILSIIYIFKGE